MTAAQILAELQPLGRESYRRVMLRHGVVEPFFGVKIEELQKIRKRIRKHHPLALELYATSNYDAQYLAIMIADERIVTADELRTWIADARSKPLASAVAGLAADSPCAWPLALEWTEASDEMAAEAGWCTLSGLVSVRPDEALDLPALRGLLTGVQRTIHQQPDNVRYAMNGFVIAIGAAVGSLTQLAIETAEKIGLVSVDMGDTSCQVPFAPDYIRKIEQRGSIGKKRKSARC